MHVALHARSLIGIGGGGSTSRIRHGANKRKKQQSSDLSQTTIPTIDYGDDYSTSSDLTFVGPNSSYISDTYYFPVSIGSERIPLFPLFDTTTDDFWVACDCIECANASLSALPVEATYSPLYSYSHKFVLCDDPLCSSKYSGCTADQNVAPHLSKSDPFCAFNGSTTDDSATGTYEGHLLIDTVNVPLANGSTSADIPIMFGCGAYQTAGLLGENNAYEGILGLGPGSVFLAQVSGSNPSFAFCLSPQTYNETDETYMAKGGSHIILGAKTLPSPASTVALRNDTGLISVNPVGMKFGDTELPVPAGGLSGLYFDTTTFYAAFPNQTVVGIFQEILKLLPLLKIDQASSSESPCFDATVYMKNGTSLAQFLSKLPNITFVLDNKVAFSSSPSAYFEYIGPYSFCSYILPTTNLPYIGGPWFTNKFLLFDYDAGTMQFLDASCDSAPILDAVKTSAATAAAEANSRAALLNSPPPSPPPPKSASSRFIPLMPIVCWLLVALWAATSARRF